MKFSTIQECISKCTCMSAKCNDFTVYMWPPWQSCIFSCVEFCVTVVGGCFTMCGQKYLANVPKIFVSEFSSYLGFLLWTGWADTVSWQVVMIHGWYSNKKETPVMQSMKLDMYIRHRILRVCIEFYHLQHNTWSEMLRCELVELLWLQIVNYILPHWSLEDLDVILNMHFLVLFYWLVSSDLLMI